MNLQTELERTKPDYVVYSSFTNRGGNDVLWHPDRKFFLVGKRITREWLADMQAPAF